VFNECWTLCKRLLHLYGFIHRFLWHPKQIRKKAINVSKLTGFRDLNVRLRRNKIHSKSRDSSVGIVTMLPPVKCNISLCSLKHLDPIKLVLDSPLQWITARAWSWPITIKGQSLRISGYIPTLPHSSSWSAQGQP
jgi:hypothetical protein